MEEIKHKVIRIEDEQNKLKEKQSECANALSNIQMSYESMSRNLEKLTIIASDTSKLKFDIEMIKKEMSHKQDIIDGRLKGSKELVDKDIKEIRKDLADIYALIKKVVWGVVTGLLSGGAFLILKVVGVV